MAFRTRPVIYSPVAMGIMIACMTDRAYFGGTLPKADISGNCLCP